MSADSRRSLAAARQSQFLDVVSRDEATRRFREAINTQPLGVETVPLSEAVTRVLAEDVASQIDVPGFDRSNVDGFAVQASDTFGAMEEEPRIANLNLEVISPGIEPEGYVSPGTATPIATGGMLPRGADAVVMIEDTDVDETTDPPQLSITRAVSAGQNVSFAGSDIALGETVLRVGQVLSSREVGVLAAIGLSKIAVYRRPTVAILSTGDEIVPPGGLRPAGKVYDSNLFMLAAAVQELGGEPVPLGVVPDEETALEKALDEALQCDVVLLSGGTSKGAGDLSYQVVTRRVTDPGIVAHGVALKPGKPICLAATEKKPVVILPGFPTSAIFTFHEFVAPIIRQLAGLSSQATETVTARLPVRVNSQRGRTEFLLVGLVNSPDGLSAYPMGKGSGSVTTFSLADGFLTIDQHTEQIAENSKVMVTKLAGGNNAADLVFVGSHCVGLDQILSQMNLSGRQTKTIFVGSQAGLNAARKNDCDLAGLHLLDAATGEYNTPFLDDNVVLIPGYLRWQCIVYRSDDIRFDGLTPTQAIELAIKTPDCRMVNRNQGSGTRILVDELLDGEKPSGYAMQPRSHNAVAAAIQQGRADWGVAIESVAINYGLKSIRVRQEQYDFVVPRSRFDSPVIQEFRKRLTSDETQKFLEGMGFTPIHA
ncbi:molybdopterin biosynthesis protein [Thalassoroseus pseudoceratinae]|uniref:molybdopterin biosynthesis protein n=1 Tax=Thalassoroseus pseudoceratinae TaxID=2713176 RepID=UPI001420D08E|nr:molybdopterin biosynthesis protein [Thalassoroseus pseudoceratinae]